MIISSLILIPGNAAEAKAAPKLSSKSVLLAKGGTRKITLENGSGSWSVEGEDVIKIKKATESYVMISPVGAGKAVVKCMTGGRELTCKVKVLNNSVGKAETDLGYGLVVGKSFSFSYTISEGVAFDSTEYDTEKGKVTVKTSYDEEEEETTVKVKVKALKPGHFVLRINYLNGDEAEYEEIPYVFINGFRGKRSVKKSKANYRKWRKEILSSMVTPEMSTWEIIDGIGALISGGKYSNKGGATGIQLWYGGNGTCLSGAIMMNDFLNDLGIKSKVHFAGNDGGAKDIFGFGLIYAYDHRNVNITLGGKKYTLNPQPGVPWPYGTVKR